MLGVCLLVSIVADKNDLHLSLGHLRFEGSFDVVNENAAGGHPVSAEVYRHKFLVFHGLLVSNVVVALVKLRSAEYFVHMQFSF